MELNREQIMNALACRTGNIIGCMNDECAYFQKGCERALYRDALSLIEELTEENERLRADNIYGLNASQLAKKVEKLSCENERLRAISEQLYEEMSERVIEECEIERKLTVRKMQKRLKNKSVSISTIHGTAKMVNARWVDQIAKEMLEGEKHLRKGTRNENLRTGY